MGDFTTEWERPEFDSVPTLAENMVYLLPGCDAVLVRKSLQWAYREFCRRSAALRTWRRIPVVNGETRYPIAPVLSGEIDCVTRVELGLPRREVGGWRVFGDPPVLELSWNRIRHDIRIGPQDVEWVQDMVNVGSLPVETGERPHFHSAWSMWAEAVEIPHIGEERAPKAFLQRHGDALVDGALARLFSMQGKPWTDAEQFRQRAVAYENAVSEAKDRSMRGGAAANAGATFALDMGGMV